MPGSGKIIALGGGKGTVTNVTGTSPVTSSGGATPAIGISGVTGEQGNGALLQLSTGTVNSNRVAKFDANGNTINSSTSDDGTNVTFTEPALMPAGSATLPAVSYSAEAALGLFRSSAGVEGLSGSFSMTGGFVIAPLATPGAPVVTPTNGVGTTWTYKIVASDVNGTTAASAAGSTAAGAATLDGTHFNTITWSAVVGTATYKVYRTVVGTSPNTTGLIGTVNSGSALSLVDNGLAGDSSTAPVSNTTGQINSSGTNTLQINGGDQTLQMINADGSYFAGQGNNGTRIAGTGVVNASAKYYGWSASGANQAIDTFLTRGGIATVQLGNANAASPVNQTLRSQGSRGGTDTDVAGSNFTFQPGTGTGAAAISKILVRGPAIGSTGTTAQTQIQREVICHTKTGLTNNTATAIVTLATVSGGFASCQLQYTIEASDGTDFQCETGVATVAAVNKAAALTIGTVSKTDTSSAVSSGTLTVTWTAVANATSIDFKVTSNSSLTTTTNRVIVKVLNLSYVSDITLD